MLPRAIIKLIAIAVSSSLLFSETAQAASAPLLTRSLSAPQTQGAASAFREQALLLAMTEVAHPVVGAISQRVKRWGGALQIGALLGLGAGVVALVVSGGRAPTASVSVHSPSEMLGQAILAMGLLEFWEKSSDIVGWFRFAYLEIVHDIRFILHSGKRTRVTNFIHVMGWVPAAVVLRLTVTGSMTALAVVLSTLLASVFLHTIPSSRLRAASRRDPLTGAWNRSFLGMTTSTGEFDPDGHLPSMFRRSILGYTKLSAIIVDLDKFKAVNDAYEHEGGDAVLKAVADVLQKGLRPEDELVRYGGEEFLILLPDTDVESAGRAAERLRSDVENTPVFLPDSRVVATTASFGVVGSYEDAQGDVYLHDKLDAWIKRADDALYSAKAAGRNRVIVLQGKPWRPGDAANQPTIGKSVGKGLAAISNSGVQFLERLRNGLRPMPNESWFVTTIFGISLAGLATVVALAYEHRIAPLAAYFATLALLEVIYRIWLRRALDAEILDVLTGAWKRAFLGLDSQNGFLPKLFMQATMRPSRKADRPVRPVRPSSLIMVDIDNFKKEVNDRHGHLAGDAVLQAVRLAIAKALFSTDKVVRYGGEEFLLILPNSDLAAAQIAAEKVLTAIRQVEIPLGNEQFLRVTASLGVAEASSADGGAPLQAVANWIKRADAALYRAKNSGKDRIVVSGSDDGGGSTAGPVDAPPTSPTTPQRNTRATLRAA